MVDFKEISVDQALACIENGEFAPEIIGSNTKVAVVLSQGWCPQWAGMQHFLKPLKDSEIDIWTFIYDESPIFQQFLQFKERTLGNDEIPYIRYYRDGQFITATNAMNEERFLEIFERFQGGT